jgi:uncharacterized protein (UPF0261 family)
VMDLAQPKHVVIIGTLDTKGPEIAYLKQCLEDLGCRSRVIDIGVLSAPSTTADVCREEVCARAGAALGDLISAGGDKVHAMEIMARGAAQVLEDWIRLNRVSGVIALGGGVGTWVGTTLMRALPFGLPKIIVSTIPYDIRAHLGTKDIVVFPSVADILGLNPTLRTVLRNAAAALAGMAALPDLTESSKKVIGMTALGVTTPLVLASRRILEEKGFEVTSFHATGRGGSAFEEWTGMGLFAGVLDLSLNELTSLLFHGVAMPEETRLEGAGKKGVAQVVVPGGVDFISRGPVDTLSREDRKRLHYRHSPFFTHVRTTPKEMEKVAEAMAKKLNPSLGPTAVVIPLKGLSDQNREGGMIYEPEADRAFVEALKRLLDRKIRLIEVEAHINDEAVAQRVCALLVEMM